MRGKINECEICGGNTGQRIWRCNDHYRCDGCGTTVGICYRHESLTCDPCREKQVKEMLEEAKEMDWHETRYTSEPVCPYCGYNDFDDTWEWGSSGDHQCSKCDGVFEYEVEYSPSWSTNKKE